MLELALVMPILFLLMGAIIELGLLLWAKNHVVWVTREACRQGVLNGEDSDKGKGEAERCALDLLDDIGFLYKQKATFFVPERDYLGGGGPNPSVDTNWRDPGSSADCEYFVVRVAVYHRILVPVLWLALDDVDGEVRVGAQVSMRRNLKKK